MSAAWPFPGLVWGDYPQRQLPLRRKARRSDWGTPQLEGFAREAVTRVASTQDASTQDASMPESASSTVTPSADAACDAVSAALLKACAALAQTHGIKPRWQQVMAARALLEQRLVELDTGEGKTFAVALAAAAAAKMGTPVHVVTANDYLAQRDAHTLAPFYASMGLRCGFVTQPMQPAQRREAYACHVTYVTGKELCFDYLRDAMLAPATGSALEQRIARMTQPAGPATPAAQRVLRGLCFAILDEADTMLIDEARVPLVLAQAQAAAGEREFLQTAWLLAQDLREGEHFRLSADGLQARLLPAGRSLVALWPQEQHALHGHPSHRESTVELALVARHVLQQGRDYVIRNGKIALVDEQSGRLSHGRAWSRGLHQLVEMKESVALTSRNETVSQITYQRFFARYLRLAGISGTLREARAELSRVYGLSMIRIEPHKPRQVHDFGKRLFADSPALWAAVAERAQALAAAGQPVLIGVNTVSQSQALSAEMAARGIAYQVLDAHHDEAEQDVLALAGRAGTITVATSMAGRGSDILLDEQALAAGGLHVLLCQLNASGRVDRQFLGRAGRQGQPASVEHWLAADFAAIASVPLAVRRLWLRGTRETTRSFAAYLRLLQALRTYTEMKQRVSLLRSAESAERDLAFTGNS